MKKPVLFSRTVLSTAVASCLMAGGLAWASDSVMVGEMGSGLQSIPVAGKDYVAGQVIVGYQADVKTTQAAIQAAQAAGGQVKETLDGPGGAVLLDFGTEENAQAAIPMLRNQQGVAYVERNGIVRLPTPPKRDLSKKSKLPQVTPQSVSTDPGTGFQYHLTVIRKTAALPPLSPTPPMVAVIDTGVDYTHPDLVGKVVLGRNTVANTMDPFDDNGHGTHVAGIIAARSTNGDYGEGVCPDCQILAIKVLGGGGWGTDFDVAQGMQYALQQGVKVINMSLGGGYSTLIAQQVQALKTAGRVLVAAAGNDDTDDTTDAFPGADPDTALRVMATEQHDCRAYFSNFSPAANPTLYNIAAPGWNIPSTTPDTGFAYFSGTSMASPVVAGSAALVWGQLPNLTRDQLVSQLLNKGKTITCGFAAPTQRVDVRRAITGLPETVLLGRLLDPFTGKAPSVNTLPANAWVSPATDTTDRGGFYEITGPAVSAAQYLRGGGRADYVTALLRTNIPIVNGVVNGPYTDALPRTQPAGHATITLDWKNTQPTSEAACTGCNGWDLDLYVKLPSGQYIGYSNPGDLLTAPFVVYPRDSADDLEPLETIVIGGSAANGVYKVFADNLEDSWNNSLASVQMYNGATAIGTFYPAPPAACGANEFWYVGDLTKANSVYTWTPVNTCSNTLP